MNNQEAFDRIANHIFTQGERAYTEGDGCQYRTKTGLKCAVGALIPDEDYYPGMERISLFEISQKVEALRGLDISMLRSLQTVHDDRFNWASSETIKSALRNVGDRYELNTDVLNHLEFHHADAE